MVKTNESLVDFNTVSSFFPTKFLYICKYFTQPADKLKDYVERLYQTKKWFRVHLMVHLSLWLVLRQVLIFSPVSVYMLVCVSKFYMG